MSRVRWIARIRYTGRSQAICLVENQANYCRVTFEDSTSLDCCRVRYVGLRPLNTAPLYA